MKKARHASEPVRSDPDPINPAIFPCAHESGSLHVGDSVWYRNQRYYIEYVPASWDKGTFIRIADCLIRPDQPAPLSRTSFTVPADMVELAPVKRNKLAKQPTKHAIEVIERKKATGQKDVGDEVAVALRACKDLEAVFKLAAKLLKEPVDNLHAKYGHLNPGQQRMNLGNRLRGAHKKGLIKL